MTQSPQTNAKGFSKAFWVSNTVELFERMAYYAVFIVLTIYLSNILGFNDFEASMISGLFSGGLYLLPIFTGAYADKIGFRKSMIIAFSLLSAGYLGLGVLPTLLEAAGLVEYGEVTRFSGLADSSERWMVATGWNYYGQCDVDSWNNIVAVAAGEVHTVGLRSDGTVVVAGDNVWGECNVDGWTDIVAVAAGWGHTVGLRSDGTVVATGWNDAGQCDVSDWKNIRLPQK